MMVKLTALTLILILYFTPAIAKDKAVIIGLTGEFHGDEINFNNKDTVYELYQDLDGFKIRKRGISVTSVYDAVVDDEGKNQKSGKLVKFTDNITDDPKDNILSVILIKAPFLNNSTVPSGSNILPSINRYFKEQCLYDDPDVKHNDQYLEILKLHPEISGFIIPDKTCTITLNDKFYNIDVKIRAIPGDPGATVKAYYDLTFNEQNKTQTLNDIMSLDWVGDIDGDGKLDILTSWSHYNGSGSNLYLSTYAVGKNLFGLAAEFSSTGC